MLRIGPIIVVTALYALQFAVFLWLREWANATIFLGYAIANIGVIAMMGV